MIYNNLFEKSPLEELEFNEFHEMILKFCTYVCMLKNKKLNYPSIFVAIVEDKGLLELYTEFCGFDNTRDSILEFLKFDESITKSKFIKKVINNGRI
jgi:hypothetical protein